MKKRLKNILKQFIPPIILFPFRKLKPRSVQLDKLVVSPRSIDSFSQHYEDLVIDGLLKCKLNGFYVDVGAYDPDQFSNTKRFWLRGWRGINIEPQTNRYQRFLTDRPGDINLNCGVHYNEGSMTFYQLEIETLSTFDRDQALKNAERFECRVAQEVKVEVWSLKSILDKHLKKDQVVDFISIDTEGNDFNVLKSNDWSVYRPGMILIEFGALTYEINSLLKSNGYELIYHNNTNGLYADRTKESWKY